MSVQRFVVLAVSLSTLVLMPKGYACNNYCKEYRFFHVCVLGGGLPAFTTLVYEHSTCIRCVGSNECSDMFGSVWTCVHLGMTRRAIPGVPSLPNCNCAAGRRNNDTKLFNINPDNDDDFDIDQFYTQIIKRYQCQGPWGTNPDHDDLPEDSTSLPGL